MKLAHDSEAMPIYLSVGFIFRINNRILINFVVIGHAKHHLESCISVHVDQLRYI
jgi:hypothetical protein